MVNFSSRLRQFLAATFIVAATALTAIGSTGCGGNPNSEAQAAKTVLKIGAGGAAAGATCYQLDEC